MGHLLKMGNKLVDCDICNSNDYDNHFLRNDDHWIVKCKRCQFCYINPRPSWDVFENIYKKAKYFKSDDEKFGYLDYEAVQEQNTFWELIKKSIFATSPFPIKNCLDIGCATGNFLKLMQDSGVSTVGVELSPYSAQKARKKGLKVYTSKFEDLSFNETFALVTLFDLIEHVESPTSLLNNIKKIMAKDSLIVITTPNLRKSFLDKDQWIGYLHSHEHLYFFTPETITALLRKTGFTVIKIDTDDVFYYPTTLKEFIDNLSNILFFRKMIRAFFMPLSWYYKKRKFGHQMIVYAVKK